MLVVVHDVESLQEALASLAKEGKRLALVPTMGALHAGHMSLIKLASDYADAVAVSIFVNPSQFGKGEDFDKYPRMLSADIKKSDDAGASIVYAPSVEDMYPTGYATSVAVGGMDEILCGRFRPGHFSGVATVVAKLLLRTLPHVAVFGEKDYQQLCVIRRMAEDLDIPVEIIGAPTMREGDGLALSSRNAYLTDDERKLAPKVFETLTRAANRIKAGGAVKDALAEGMAALTAAGFRVDYLELRSEDELKEMHDISEPSRLLVAAWLGKTRLIDNIAVE